MTDRRLRESERRARTTGALDDRARLLADLVRTGRITRAQLELAAFCGNDAALALVYQEDYQQSTTDGYVWWKRLVIPEGTATRYVPIPSESSDWLRELSRWGYEAMLRAGLAVMVVGHEHVHPNEECKSSYCVYRATVAVVDDWLDCQCDKHMKIAQDHVRRLALVAHMAEDADMLAILHRDAWCRQIGNLLLLDKCLQIDQCLNNAVSSAADFVEGGEAAVLDEVRRTLTAWALGGIP